MIRCLTAAETQLVTGGFSDDYSMDDEFSDGGFGDGGFGDGGFGDGAGPYSGPPMPSGPSDSSWGQIACKTLESLGGVDSFVSDMSCGVDWTGDNPQDSINQSPERQEQIAEAHNGEGSSGGKE